MLPLRDKMQAGTATPQERALYGQVRGMARIGTIAPVPRKRVTPMPLGSAITCSTPCLWSALAPAAGSRPRPSRRAGAGLGTTLGSLGSLAGTAGRSAASIGQGTGQDWLASLGQVSGRRWRHCRGRRRPQQSVE